MSPLMVGLSDLHTQVQCQSKRFAFNEIAVVCFCWQQEVFKQVDFGIKYEFAFVIFFHKTFCKLFFGDRYFYSFAKIILFSYAKRYQGSIPQLVTTLLCAPDHVSVAILLKAR